MWLFVASNFLFLGHSVTLKAQLEEQQLLAELKAIETENSENEKSLEELKRQMRQYEDMEKKYLWLDWFGFVIDNLFLFRFSQVF